ncbi:MAG: pectinesterase family protein [Acidobacteriaceae bacterium]
MPSSHFRRIFTALAIILAAPLAVTAFGQDTRQVVEPHYPPVCIQLKAHLSAPNGKLTAAEERMEDTARIQQAIDHCSPSRAVELSSSGSNHVFLTAPIHVRPGVTLLIDSATALYASRNPRDYDLTPGSCGVVDKRGHGCKPLITADDAPNSAIMGQGVIDGRGGATLLGQKVTWWDLAHEAQVKDLNQSCPRILVVDHSNNFILYRITLRNSPNFHVAVYHTNGFTAWGVRINTPALARNTDGIDPGSSKNVTITHSYIHDGDDDVAIKAGPGGANYMTISDDHFYTGHGMSIGSETNGGASHILVRHLTLDGTTNGIRIKSDLSRGGLVQNVTYDNVCMRNVKYPLLLTPHYSRAAGHLIPWYRNITLHNIHILTPGHYILVGEDPQHPLGVHLDNVWADGLSHSTIDAEFANFTLGPNLGNLIPSGNHVTVTKLPGSKPGIAIDCTGKFPPFPVNTSVPPSAESIPNYRHALYVSLDSTAEFHTIQSAVDAAPGTGATIRIAPGVYRETVVIHQPNIRLIGATPAQTVIVDDHSAATTGSTLKSATVTVTGDNFFAKNITFANDWNRTHQQASEGSQALALNLTADKAVLSDVRLLGNQDTLYAGTQNCHHDSASCKVARQYFSHCYIEGNVDFVFGDAKAYFDHCTIRSTPHSEGMITAQSKHFPTQSSAFVFHDCRLTAYPGVKNVYLGRPWRPYATVVYLHTWMGPQIAPAGWREWHPGQTHRLQTAFFAEYDSTGPGAHPHQRESHSHQLKFAQASRFSLKNFFPKWRPSTSSSHHKQTVTAVQ